MKTKTIKSIFKSYKNTSNTTKWLLNQFPENYRDMCYVEPYCGGANLLFTKEKSLTEVINDKDFSLISIYQCLRDEPKEFLKKLNHYKYCEETFTKIKKKTPESHLDKSICEYILRKMSKSELKNSFSNLDSIRWKGYLKNLQEISNRIKEVFIFNKNAIEIIEIFNTSDCLLYCDPPFLHETKTSKKVYSSEMELDEHINLSHYLNNFKGKVLISGVTSPLYNRLYKSWNMVRCKFKKKDKKAEVVWRNF